jgi:hypothetical protein
VAANCRPDAPTGLGVGAKEKAAFDLVNVKGNGGQVLAFDDEEKFGKTVDAFEAAKMLAGPHRYGSKKARVFVQMNDETPATDGTKVRGIVANLGDLVAPPPGADLPKAAPEPVATAPELKGTPAMEACRKLETAGVASKCRQSDTSPNTVKFGEQGSATAGMVSAYDDEKMFKTVSAGMAKDADKRTATKGNTLVVWKPAGDAVDAKIRAAVDAL